MDSLVMVAYTFFIAVGLPLGEIAMVSMEGGGAEGPGAETVSIAELSSADNEAGISDDDVINRPEGGSAMTSSGKSDHEATTPVVSEEDDEGVTSLLLRSASGSIETETGEDEISEKTTQLQGNKDSIRSTEPEIPSTTSVTTLTTALQVKNLDDDSLRWHSAIVEALEKLGVLESDGKWCYSVERISKSPTSPSPSSPSPPLWTVELLIEAKSAVFSPVSSHSKSAPRGAMLVGRRRSDVTAANAVTTSGVGCDVNGTSGGEDCTGVTTDGDFLSIPRTETKLTQRALKPNRTQILVISTCSSVIGVFFAVALVIRIRNHLRRTRSLSIRRRGAIRHGRAHVTSGQRVTSSAPPGEANWKENIVGKKEDDGVHNNAAFVPSPGFLFGRHRRWSSGQRRVGPSSSSSSSSSIPRLPLLRHRSEFTRLFVSERWEREAAKRYFRQLSLTCPSNAVFVGEKEMTSPTVADVTTFSRRWENFHRLDIV